MERSDIEIVRKSFQEYQDKNIIIYGTGKVAQKIVNALKDFNIIGIMDRVQTEGLFCGYKILMWNDLRKFSNGVIIIATSRKNYKEIYLRIREKCAVYDFKILGSWGEKLTYYPWAEHLDKDMVRYCRKSKKELIEKIQQYDVISFDIFDTLVMRQTLEPGDVFEIVENRIKKKNIHILDFKRKRMEADSLCINGTIYDIYDCLQNMTLISDKEKCNVLHEELMCERSVLLARHEMVEIMQSALVMGKKVCLISDMYLPKDIIEKILISLKITGYSEIYLSCELKMKKDDRLYERYIEDNVGKKCLHIGDNFFSDVIKPRQYGIDTYEIKSAYSMLKISNLHGILGYIDTINERIIMGMIISKLFNSPFALFNTGGVLTIRKWEDFGSVFFAPLAIKYITDIVKYLNIKKDYDGVLFAARDGYLLQHMYEIIRNQKGELPQSYYFLTSRKASLRAAMEAEDIVEILKRYIQYDMNEETIEKYVGIDGMLKAAADETFDLFIEHNKKYLIEKAKESKKNYEYYLNKEGIKQEGKYLFCEVYSKGTTQYALNHLFHTELDGFYLMRYYFETNYGVSVSAVYDINYQEKETNMLMLHETLIELFLTSAKPALQEMGAEGVPVYEMEHRNIKEIENLQKVWRAIEEFFCAFLNFYAEEEEIKKEFPEKIFLYLDNMILENECEELTHMKFFDNLMGIWRETRILME